MKSSKYPNLYRYDYSPFWVFRKFSAAKGKEFVRATGETQEAQAYKAGMRAFSEWVAQKNSPRSGPTTFKTLALEVLQTKEPPATRPNTYATAKNQIEKHLIPAFGHLRPNQITRLLWERWVSSEHRRPGGIKKFFNAHKAIMEVLRRALEEGFIERLPELKNPDAKSESGTYIEDEIVARIIASASPDTALLVEIMHLMGARPGEILQWEFAMIDWRAGTIAIPGRITKTKRARTIPINSRVLDLLKSRSLEGSPFVFPAPGGAGPMKGYKTGWRSALMRASCSRACGVHCAREKGSRQYDCGFDPKAFARSVFGSVTIYDLRHTWVSNQARKNLPMIDVARYIDTSPAMISSIYAKSHPSTMKEIAG